MIADLRELASDWLVEHHEDGWVSCDNENIASLAALLREVSIARDAEWSDCDDKRHGPWCREWDAREDRIKKLEKVAEAAVEVSPATFDSDLPTVLWDPVLLSLREAGYDVEEWAAWAETQRERAEEVTRTILRVVNRKRSGLLTSLLRPSADRVRPEWIRGEILFLLGL